MLFDGKASSTWKYLNEGRKRKESGKNLLCKPNKVYKIWSCPTWNNRELQEGSEQGRASKEQG